MHRALSTAGISASIHCIPEGVNVSQWVANLAAEYDLLVAAGGDGTVSNVAGAVAQFDKTLGITSFSPARRTCRKGD